MKKTALLFAGQGAQFVGMGKDLISAYPTAKHWFEKADSILGYSLSKLCFEGPEEELTKTENAQPAVYVMGWVAYQLLKEQVPTFEFHAVAGLSLGEITALTAAGSIDFEDGLRLVRYRGLFMQEACQSNPGGMVAIIGLDRAKVEEVARAAEMYVANYNCPGQIVISGPASNISRAIELAKAAGAKRVVELNVAGAFHTPLMQPAAEKLGPVLERIQVKPPSVPVVTNVTGRLYESDAIKSTLLQQIVSPVRWEDCVRHLVDNGVRRFIELGPGTVLSGLVKKIVPRDGFEVLNIGDVGSLQATVASLQA